MIIKAYLHSDDESMRELGEESGLKFEALEEFSGALYEVEFELDVNEETGKYKIIKVSET